MAIIAKFGNYIRDARIVNKEIYNPIAAGAAEHEIKAYEEVDDITCNFILNGSGFHNYNYMQVTFPGGLVKYYFIEKRSGMPANMTRITATCDVLYTYASSINASSAILNRTANTKYVNFLLKDNKMTTISKTVLSSKRSEKITDNEEYFYVGIIQNKASLREV